MANQTIALLRAVENADPTSVRDYEAAGGYQALRRIADMEDQAILDELKRADLVGRGGAGFPTGMKWEMVYREAEPVKYVICNADEGEAGAFKDRKLLADVPLRVIEGMTIAGRVLHAKEGFLYLRGEYYALAAQLRAAIENAKAAGYLGKNALGKFDFDITVVTGAASYLCGEETALLNSIEGKRGEPRKRPPYPTNQGLNQKPTLLNNTETFANIPLVFAEGPEAYNRHVTKLVCLSGCVKNRGVYEVELGSVTLHELIHGENFGGGTESGAPVAFYQVGGQSAALGFPEQIYTPFGYREMATAGLGVGCGSIVVLDTGVCPLDYCRSVVEFFVHESCGKCTPCRDGAPLLLALLEMLCHGEGQPRDLDTIQTLAATINDLSFCGLGQSVCKALFSLLKYRRAEVEAHMQGTCPAGACKLSGGADHE